MSATMTTQPVIDAMVMAPRQARYCTITAIAAAVPAGNGGVVRNLGYVSKKAIANLKDCGFNGASMDQRMLDFTKEDIPKLQASSRTVRTRSARRRTDRQVCESLRQGVRAQRCRERKRKTVFDNYRNPKQLLPGAVLLIGSARSGAQTSVSLLHVAHHSGGWRFVGLQGEVALRISGRFRSNSGNMLYAALLAGAGSAWSRRLLRAGISRKGAWCR
jgi:hypothetical protein